MKILFCASEVAPIIKIGGLGDVAGSLPKALAALGLKVTVLVPLYATVDRRQWGVEQIGKIEVSYGGKTETVGVHQARLPDSDVPVLFLDHDTYLSGGGKHAFEGSVSETERFAFFSTAIVSLVSAGNLRLIGGAPDIIHCNDWHTGLVPVLLKHQAIHEVPRTLLTIHNLSYQGIGQKVLAKTLGIINEESIIWDEANGDIDCLLQGILKADAINTVSETYAKEILTPEFGEGMDQSLALRREDLYGIVNGIDYQTWNPQTDQYLQDHYGVDGVTTGKRAAKRTLQEALKLPIVDVPAFAFIGRIEPKQKGIDLIEDWLRERIKNYELGMRNEMQVIILGMGDPAWEDKLRAMQESNDDWLSVQLRFDEQLAHLIYAGADFVLIPSRFEPCGLPQMIAQRYGTLPIVRGVGGLKDTVLDGETGLVFQDYTSNALAQSVERALAIFPTEQYQVMSRKAMAKDFSWAASAKKYLALYEVVNQGFKSQA